ncbi:NAD(P)H-binding protein [Roseateles sp. SL47]|uniref:NAD-dependent epimerase/dehydratase family protein n=1 Tax=Roseateles sp. SL47 TaxID=2995138 RepID=UPI00226E318B|nr:NAD-dependent epimerase/dehydratase family protein [Roseateles sp. SL47]WAC74803.1 NAD(P)H-binding protein [Roseateles sp. SL47]
MNTAFSTSYTPYSAVTGSSAPARTVLVLGATGGIGGAVARSLRDAGWTVKALRRGLEVPQVVRDGMQWLNGDAMQRDDVMAAAQGCSVIVHAVNPPGYRRWSELVLPMLDNTLAAATEQRATVVLPGTVYNFGPDSLPRPHELSPQQPVTRKGAIRVEMERRLRQGVGQGAFRVIVLRAGDFFGPGAANNWFSQGLVTAGQPVRKVQQPGRSGVGHQWAYLPDVAETMKRLIERRQEWPAFAPFHFEGHWDADGRQMVDAIRRVVLRRTGETPRIVAFPWWAVTLGSPLVPLFRELAEMRYLWRVPLHMNSHRLTQALGAQGVPHTDWDLAVERTLVGIGCLPSAADGAPAANITANGMSPPATARKAATIAHDPH